MGPTFLDMIAISSDFATDYASCTRVYTSRGLFVAASQNLFKSHLWMDARCCMFV